MKRQYIDKEKNISIQAGNLELGSNIQFGRDINIKVRGTFKLGDNSIIGDRFQINAEEVEIGEYFYNGPTDSRGMVIGGGSSNFPDAKLTIGDRVVCHTGHINLAAPVYIGDDVGLSHDVDIITHGFWGSVLEGYPRKFEDVLIGDNVIVGWKTVIMSGVDIADNVVIGAHSTVVKSLTESRAVYGGTPAKLISKIGHHPEFALDYVLNTIVDDFKQLMTYYKEPYKISAEYPFVQINDLKINVETRQWEGTHSPVTDAFRDFLRRYGIRVFVPHGFRFNLERR